MTWSGVCSSLSHSSYKRGHTPFVQAGAETADAGVEVVKLDPLCCWEIPGVCVCRCWG